MPRPGQSIANAMITASPEFQLLPYNNTPSDESHIRLKNTSSWTYCGPLLPLSSAALPPSFHTWSRATVDGCITPSLLSFLSFAHSFLSDADISHYWITVRATKATAEYDLPRWHTDDYVVGEKSKKGAEIGWKLVSTLLGPGTLFIEDGARARAVQQRIKRAARKAATPHTCASVRCHACAATSDDVRARLSDALRDYNVLQAPSGVCSFFRVGDRDGAVHSEPPCPVDRIFVNVIPGTETGLTEYMSTWGMEFPRAWTIGVPLFAGYEEG